jgi:hypothetical protein
MTEPRKGEPRKSTRQLVYYFLRQSAEGKIFWHNAPVDYRLIRNEEFYEDGKLSEGSLLYLVRRWKPHISQNELRRVVNALKRHYRGAYGCLNRERDHRCQACEEGQGTYPILIGEDYWANNKIDRPEWVRRSNEDAIGRKIPERSLYDIFVGGEAT